MPIVTDALTDSMSAALPHTTAVADTLAGVQAERVPYTLGRDNIITFTLVLCFVAMIISVARSRRFVKRQMRNFLRTQTRRTTILSETTKEIGFQLFLMVLTCLTIALVLFFYTDEYVADLSALPAQPHSIIIHYFLLLVAFLSIKLLLYRITNWVFFDRVVGVIWMKSQLLLWSLAGIILYPVMLLVVYFGLQPYVAMGIVLLIVAIIETLSFYRSYLLFFKEKRFPIQNVLYLCTLEIVPILLLYKSLVTLNSKLTVNIY